MNSDQQLTETVKGIIETKGKIAVEQAKNAILSLTSNTGIVPTALKYFAQMTIGYGLPVFPALTYLSCEAVGGNAEKATSVGAALRLIAGAADIHDDIIDQSSVKYSKKTLYGKFGRDVALLAGDVLLIQGSMLLYKECESLFTEQRKEILNLLSEALFEISDAEAKESHLMKNHNIMPNEYYEIIRQKAVVPEMHCKIGAILGNANKTNIEALGNYGRIFGIASIVRDEFIDLYEYPELQNRINNECLPLPMLYALQNSSIREEVKTYIGDSRHERRKLSMIRKRVLGSEQVGLLKKDLELSIRDGLKYLQTIGDNIYLKQLALLLRATMTDL